MAGKHGVDALSDDASLGWEAAAAAFMAARSAIGVAAVRTWAASLPPGGDVLDIGAGSGEPLAAALIADGCRIFAIDASPTLVAAFRRRFPEHQVACEPAEQSRFFGRTFDGALAIGLMFLLPAETQRALIPRVAAALKPQGRFLFTAPEQACTWTDSLTGRESRSLGLATYRDLLSGAGLSLDATFLDEGGNHYISAQLTATA